MDWNRKGRAQLSPVVRIPIVLTLLFLSCCVAGPAESADYPSHTWSAALYAGPSTTKYFGAVLQKLNFEPTGVMIGLAADRPFLDLGWDIALGGEGQITHYMFGHSNTSFALGLGFVANSPFGLAHSSISIFDGPSYALDPPYTSIGYGNKLWPSARKKLLNYIALEYAVALNSESRWDGIFRLYHRSGAWGYYSNGDDDGLAIGLGVKYHL
jgi:hypothetical protein